ncbi:MAG: hypothetical protein KBB88_00385 [Candidatus Pacebacteria bacterium]|nr:hypothetical protein [Candidatus Paceibacterota bacterium]
MDLITFNAIKVLLPAIIAFIVGISLTPLLSHYMYKLKLWRRYSRCESTDSTFKNSITNNNEVRTPRVGGLLVWISVFSTVALIFLLYILFPTPITAKLEFISRNQTFIPMATLLIGSLLGLIDDLLQIYPPTFMKGDPIVFRYVKIVTIILLATVVGFWLYNKLGMTSIHIPFDGTVYIGVFFLPFFIVVTLGVFSTSVIDGIDGLSGGLLASIFASYAIIALSQNKIDLAALCAVISGSTLAFLWFNIPPARFYMGETGMMGLTLTLSTVAFLTDTVLLLPIIIFPLFITSLSNIIQLLSKKCRCGKRVFIVAPFHHHLEALGWSKEKITMRYWIIGIMTASIGTIIAIVS